MAMACSSVSTVVISELLIPNRIAEAAIAVMVRATTASTSVKAVRWLG